MLQTAKKVIEVITDLLLFCSTEQLFDFLTSKMVWFLPLSAEFR